MSTADPSATAPQRSSERTSGSCLEIRPAVLSDREGIVRFYESLDAESIFMRFHSYVKDFTGYVEGRLRGSSIVLIAESCGEIVGIAEAVMTGERVAEVGVVVRRDRRRMGIGTALALSLARACRERGVEILIARVSISNEPAIRMARKLGASVRLSDEPGVVLIESSISSSLTES